jgi:predicted nucleic acid-binding Zn ribbon protein
MPGETNEPVSVGDAAALVGAELGLAEPLVFTKIVQAWPQLVGDMVAAHSRVRAVRNGVIEVLVDSPGWATEFRYLETDLVERASRLVGTGVVRAIRATVEVADAGPAEPDETGRR